MSLVWWIGLPLYGLAWGSFLGAMGYRLGSLNSLYSRSLVRGEKRSSCWDCGHALAWYDNLPLLSWLILKGRCRYCKVAIPPTYFVSEALFALLSVGLGAGLQSIPILLGTLALLSLLWVRMLERYWQLTFFTKQT